MEYRGYGESTPTHIKPSEEGIKSDSEAVMRFISSHPDVDPTKIFIFGRSLGGAVAFHVAAYARQQKIPLAGIIVENTFVSISRMIDVLLPFLSVIPFQQYWLQNQWDSSKIVSNLNNLPILYIAGDADEIVPHSQMQELYAASSTSSGDNSSVKLHIVKNGTHNETWLQGGKAYWKAIQSFLLENG